MAGPFHFLLIHGFNHGAWCWFKVIALLHAAGHNVTALDLAASGRNFEVPLSQINVSDEYHQPLYAYLEALPPEEKVVLVGHSLGGLAISSAMERFPTKIAVAVFCSAFMVGPNLTYDQINAKYFPTVSFKDTTVITDSNGTLSLLFGPQLLGENLYQRSPYEDYVLVLHLSRFTKLFMDPESKQQLAVTKEKFGSVRRVYVKDGQDLAISVPIQNFMIKNSPPDEVREISTSDHMLMISHPLETSLILTEIAKKYA